jgi:hypothetical protein
MSFIKERILSDNVGESGSCRERERVMLIQKYRDSVGETQSKLYYITVSYVLM